MNTVKPDGLNLLSARWLALGAAAGASLALVINQLGVQGPWQIIALVLAPVMLPANSPVTGRKTLMANGSRVPRTRKMK